MGLPRCTYYDVPSLRLTTLRCRDMRAICDEEARLSRVGAELRHRGIVVNPEDPPSHARERLQPSAASGVATTTATRRSDLPTRARQDTRRPNQVWVADTHIAIAAGSNGRHPRCLVTPGSRICDQR